MAIYGSVGNYDVGAMTTTYNWVVCRGVGPCPTPASGTDINQLRVSLSTLAGCGGTAAHPISVGTTEPYQTSDPTCFAGPGASVVKWSVPVGSGECQPFALVLGGELATGTVEAATLAGASCPLVNVGGPACP